MFGARIALVFATALAGCASAGLIASECDRQLLATAATKLVAEHRTQILEFIERPY